MSDGSVPQAAREFSRLLVRGPKRAPSGSTTRLERWPKTSRTAMLNPSFGTTFSRGRAGRMWLTQGNVICNRSNRD